MLLGKGVTEPNSLGTVTGFSSLQLSLVTRLALKFQRENARSGPNQTQFSSSLRKRPENARAKSAVGATDRGNSV
eukprot:496765-Rhodomonas_salina.1